MRKPIVKEPLFRLISFDSTSNCNLRCKFCFNDFKSNPKCIKNINMSLEKFKRVIDILDLVPSTSNFDGKGFYFSCLYEPTINPNFLKLLNEIPVDCKDKVFFTTNISKHLDDETIHAIANSNINHINISVETFDKELYNNLCGSRSFEIFYNNLVRISKIFNKYINPPKIRYISMVLKDNINQLIDIVKICNSEFRCDQYELRTPFYGVYPNMAFVEQQLVSRLDLENFEAQLNSLPYGNIVYDFTISKEDFNARILADSNTQILTNKNDLEKDKGGGYTLEVVPDNFYDIRIDSDGDVLFIDEKINISIINNVKNFFREKLYKLITQECKKYLYQKETNFSNNLSNNIIFALDYFYNQSDNIFLQGWAAITDESMDKFQLLLSVNDNYYKVRSFERPDVVEHFRNNNYLYSGFKCKIEKTNLIHGNNILKFNFINKITGLVEYEKEFDESLYIN